MPTPERFANSFQGTSLVLLGHGSTVNADSAAPVYDHAEALRKLGVFESVVEGFWKQEPNLAGVLRGVFSKRTVIVPLFISDGYFTEEVIPRELGFAQKSTASYERIMERDGQTFFYSSPVGTHPAMTEVLLARATDIVRQFPFPRTPSPSETALFIAGHGTGNNENSRKAIEAQVDLFRAMNQYREVHPAFMEEEPRIENIYAMTSARYVVVVPFFISDGLHSFEDIPVLLGESAAVVRKRLLAKQPTWRNPSEKHGKLVWYTRSVGQSEKMTEVILERAKEALQFSVA